MFLDLFTMGNKIIIKSGTGEELRTKG